MTNFHQKPLRLPAFSSDYHLITDKVERAIPEIKSIKIGFLQVLFSSLPRH